MSKCRDSVGPTQVTVPPCPNHISASHGSLLHPRIQLSIWMIRTRRNKRLISPLVDTSLAQSIIVIIYYIFCQCQQSFPPPICFKCAQGCSPSWALSHTMTMTLESCEWLVGLYIFTSPHLLPMLWNSPTKPTPSHHLQPPKCPEQGLLSCHLPALPVHATHLQWGSPPRLLAACLPARLQWGMPATTTYCWHNSPSMRHTLCPPPACPARLQRGLPSLIYTTHPNKVCSLATACLPSHPNKAAALSYDLSFFFILYPHNDSGPNRPNPFFDDAWNRDVY